MDTKALEKFCPWARIELIDAVRVRCARYGLDDAGRAAAAADANVVGGTVLSSEEKSRRAALYEQIERMGYDAFCERAAYSWFNRFAAIRYMELKGYLSHGVRILSSADGDFDPECLRVAGELDLPGLERVEALELMAAGSYDVLFRRIIVAQCNEFATCLPRVFDHVDAVDALTLPDNLLGHGEHDVLFHLVTDIPEDCWQNVEVLGWMYQFYNSELKDAFFKSKRKATVADLAPATQLFTPDWIVRYMVENSLGRLWMLNNPASGLREHMAYYIEPDAEHEDFIRISNPEDITFCDPACGSGHILVCAFDLLVRMYLERGYREREIPELILTKNLAGMEIDERAAQFASLQLAMVARECDRRFFGRGVEADIQVLESIELDEDSLPRALVGKKDLVEALGHLSEIGSLYTPDAGDLAAIDNAISELSGASLFGAAALEQLKCAKVQLEALSRSFDVVVANPPYMGGSSFNPFMSKWVKKHYPDTCKDLFSAFIERITVFANAHGESGVMCPFVWMFISSYEKLRNKMIDDKTLTSLVQLEYSGFSGATVPICTFTFHNNHINGYKGGYIRLSDFVGPAVQDPKALEAIQNPDCGWFYRADASTFHDIPGSPIAYWASEAVHEAFRNNPPLSVIAKPRVGLQTGDNARYLRYWFECGLGNTHFTCSGPENSIASPARWYPHNKGGMFRRWMGNMEYVVDYQHNGAALSGDPKSSVIPDKIAFLPSLTYSRISSGEISFRAQNASALFDSAAVNMYPSPEISDALLALLNSSVMSSATSFLVPTLNAQPGDIAKLPIDRRATSERKAKELSSTCISLSRADWDTQETSWDFTRNPLI